MVGPDKLDSNLIFAIRAYKASGSEANEDDGISVSLRFEGELAAIEALGFETHMVFGTDALGVVRFKDIESLVQHPGVIRIAAGRARRVDLDSAARDILARASAPISGSPTDGLWHTVVASGAFSNVADATGKDVIVAIIDTGIDYKHPLFMSQLTPARKTRIKRIWDQGLTPASITECPDVSLLASANTYGVEYKNDPPPNDQIDQALAGTTTILHKDCDGHGTHVAGIAAGGTKFPSGGNASRVGVAPEADIIAVKFLDTPDKIYYRLPSGATGAEVGWTARFRDALLYCLRTARELDKPVVVNMSFGDNSMPGDGLDDDARFVDGLMDPGQSAGPTNFPKRAVLVKSAGNDGDASSRQVARIEVPASGQIIVPFRLRDTRGATQRQWKECAKLLHKPSVGVNFWYRRTSAPLAVQFAMRLPHGGDFGSDVGVGGNLEIGFRPIVGPPPNDIGVAASSSVHRAGIEHEDPGAVPHSVGKSVHRHHVYVFVKPKEHAGTISYHPGIYETRIKAPAGTVIYAVCDFEFWSAGKFVFFNVATTLQDGTATHPNIRITSEFSATDTLGRNVITVAAYDDKNGNTTDPDQHNIASFSSRGPLRDYSDPASPLPLIADKPDIAAPGVEIDSAEGLDTEALLPRLPSWNSGIRFTEHDGTSQASPMVAGVIALMLDKNKDLNINEVRTNLSGRAAVDPATPPASTRAYGKGMVDALASHNSVP